MESSHNFNAQCQSWMRCSTQTKYFRWQIGDPDGDDAWCTDDSSYFRLVTSRDKREILTFVKCTVDEPRLLKKIHENSATSSWPIANRRHCNWWQRPRKSCHRRKASLAHCSGKLIDLSLKLISLEAYKSCFLSILRCLSSYSIASREKFLIPTNNYILLFKFRSSLIMWFLYVLYIHICQYVSHVYIYKWYFCSA